MKARLSVITLGVDDLERAVAFYRDGLGWPMEGIVGRGVRKRRGRLLQPAGRLASRALAAPQSRRRHETRARAYAAPPNSLGHNVGSQREVDDAVRQAVAAGARIVKPAQPTFGRLRRIFRGSGRAPLGGRLQPPMERGGRRRRCRAAGLSRRNAGPRISKRTGRNTVREGAPNVVEHDAASGLRQCC